MIDQQAKSAVQDEMQRLVDAMSEDRRLIVYQYLRNAYGVSMDGIGYRIDKFFQVKPDGRG